MVVDGSSVQASVQVEPRLGRVAMVASGLVAIATSAVLALSWIDTGEDATCSSVVHPGTWWGTSSCGAVMSERSVLVVLLAGAGGALLRPRGSASTSVEPGPRARRRTGHPGLAHRHGRQRAGPQRRTDLTQPPPPPYCDITDGTAAFSPN